MQKRILHALNLEQFQATRSVFPGFSNISLAMNATVHNYSDYPLVAVVISGRFIKSLGFETSYNEKK